MSRNSEARTSMLEGPIWKGLISFAIPIMLGNLFQQLYNTADTIIVGNLLGKEALAAVSSSGNLTHMLVGLLQGISMGAGILIARYYGARDRERLQLAVHTGLAFALSAGVALSVIGMLVAPQILRWMDTPADVLPNSIAYFRTYFMGVWTTFLYNMCTDILRNVGDSRRPLYYLILSSVLNVVLDLLFIGVFHGGVASAALATVIAQAVSAALCLWQLIHTDEVCRVELRKIRIHWPTLGHVVRFGLPSGIQHSVTSFANVVVQTNINAFGSNAMAGCGAYSKIEGFAFLPVTCFSMGLATFVGQNLGARQHDRVRAGVRFALPWAMLMAECIGLLIWICAPWLISLFHSDPAVVAFGVRYARVVSLFYPLLTLSHCMAGILRGAGKPTVPMAVMMGIWCVFRVLYITVMVRLVPDIAVVFTAYPVTWTISSILFVIYYRKADWIHHFDRLEQSR